MYVYANVNECFPNPTVMSRVIQFYAINHKKNSSQGFIVCLGRSWALGACQKERKSTVTHYDI
jgi:hypothetical protein